MLRCRMLRCRMLLHRMLLRRMLLRRMLRCRMLRCRMLLRRMLLHRMLRRRMLRCRMLLRVACCTRRAVCSSLGHVHAARVLIAWGASLNEVDNNGCTAAMCASEAGHVQVVTSRHARFAPCNRHHAAGMLQQPTGVATQARQPRDMAWGGVSQLRAFCIARAERGVP